MTKERVESTTVPCNQCGQKTNHDVLAREDTDGVERIPSPNGGTLDMHNSTSFQIVKCCGCGEVSFRKRFWLEEWDGVEDTYYPPRVSRRLPLWHKKLPARNGSLLREIYAALHADSRRLAMMGTRTLIDMTAVEKVGDVGGFQQQLDALVKNRYTSSRNAEVLKAAVEAGHAAAHRGHTPGSAEVNSVIDIVENLLQSAYVLNSVADDLKNKTPPRTPKDRASSTRTVDDASGTSETQGRVRPTPNSRHRV